MFLDVSARGEGVAEVVRRAAAELGVPIAAGCVGSPRELRELREAGADGVVLGDAAVRNPGLVREAAAVFGRGGVTVAICAQRRGEGYWEVCTEGGAKAERMDAYGWALAAEWLGAGELLLVSMERGGRVKPCDADFVKLIAPAVGRARGLRLRSRRLPRALRPALVRHGFVGRLLDALPPQRDLDTDAQTLPQHDGAERERRGRAALRRRFCRSAGAPPLRRGVKNRSDNAFRAAVLCGRAAFCMPARERVRLCNIIVA